DRTALVVAACQCAVIVHALRKQRSIKSNFSTIASFAGQIPVFIRSTVVQDVVIRTSLQFAAKRKGPGIRRGTINRIHYFDAVPCGSETQPGITGIGEIQPGFPRCLPAVDNQHISREVWVSQINAHVNGATLADKVCRGELAGSKGNIRGSSKQASSGCIALLRREGYRTGIFNGAGTDDIPRNRQICMLSQAGG